MEHIDLVVVEPFAVLRARDHRFGDFHAGRAVRDLVACGWFTLSNPVVGRIFCLTGSLAGADI